MVLPVTALAVVRVVVRVVRVPRGSLRPTCRI